VAACSVMGALVVVVTGIVNVIEKTTNKTFLAGKQTP